MSSQETVVPPSVVAQRPLQTINDVARLLAVSRHFIYELVRQGELHPIRVGERLRFWPDDVDRYLASRRQT